MDIGDRPWGSTRGLGGAILTQDRYPPRVHTRSGGLGYSSQDRYPQGPTRGRGLATTPETVTPLGSTKGRGIGSLGSPWEAGRLSSSIPIPTPWTRKGWGEALPPPFLDQPSVGATYPSRPRPPLESSREGHPRRCAQGMLVDKVSPSLDLLPVEARDEIEVDSRLHQLLLDELRIASEIVDPLPCAPCRAHWRPD